nr:hypothetical protein [Tanacetum cinerariifolium]
MVISVILDSSDSSKESVRTSTGRVILFGTIPTTIPDTTPSVTLPSTYIDSALTLASADYTPASPNYSPASDMKFDPSEDPSSNHIPPLPAISPFLSSTDDSLDTSGVLRCRVMILTPGQPIPHGQPYRYHPNGLIHIMTVRKRVRPLPTHRLAMIHSVDYSSSDHFALDDSLRDSSSSLSSKTSSDPSLDDQSGSSSDHSLPAPSSGMRPSHQLCSLVPCIPCLSAAITDRPSHDSSSTIPSHKRSRSPVASVPLYSPIPGALSSIRDDLLPSPKRIMSLESATNLKVSSAESSEPSMSRGTDVEMDDDVKRSDGLDIDLEIQTEINKYVAYEDAFRARGIDARVVVEAIYQEEIKTGTRGLVEVRVDRVTHPVIADDIPEKLERDNIRLRDMMDVVSQRVTRSQRRELRIQREMRQFWTMPNTRFGASRTLKGVNEQIDRRVAEALGARDTARNLEPLVGDGGKQEEVNGNGEANENGNGNRGGNGYNLTGFVHVSRECTYQDFLKCQPLSFNGKKGVVGLTRWFEKMEMVFHISNYPEKYQVKYATCILLNSALTWWNSHKRIIRIEAAYTMSLTELMKLMTEVYCPETRMVPNEEDKVERFIGGLPDNIQGNVIAVEPTKLQDAICIAKTLMDQKLKGYAKSTENKRSASLDHPCCGALPSCEVVTLRPACPHYLEHDSIHQSCESFVVGLLAVIDNEFEVWASSCELTSFWSAVVTVRIPASLCQ